MLELNNSQLADTGRSWKWHQQGGVCLELAHPADLMAIVEAVPSKPGKTINDSLKLGVEKHNTLSQRMGNGRVLENGGGQVGVCHTTGCRLSIVKILES